MAAALALGVGTVTAVAAAEDHRVARAAPTGPHLTGAQGHLDPASAGGIDARFAWTQPGGRGENVTVVDVEYATWIAQADGVTLCPSEIRDLLVRTGSSAAPSERTIGPLPDLRAAVAELRRRHPVDPADRAGIGAEPIGSPAAGTSRAVRVDLPCAADVTP